MRFDFTKGQTARYMVAIHRWGSDDHYYTHYLKDAQKVFGQAKEMEYQDDTTISIWDLQKDVRKEYYRVNC